MKSKTLYFFGGLEDWVFGVPVHAGGELSGYPPGFPILEAASFHAMGAADVVTLSSNEEGLGSVLLDALAFGKPIAATTAGGIPEIVEHDATGLLAPPRDSEALGRNIVRLLEDRALRDRFGSAARERARQFSVDRMVDSTIAVYRRLLG